MTPWLLILVAGAAFAGEDAPDGGVPTPAGSGEGVTGGGGPPPVPSIATVELQGRVVDAATRTPIPGVAIVTPTGEVVTDAEGRAALRVAVGSTLVVRAPGYVELTLPAPSVGGEWNVALVREEMPLEVVVEARRDLPVVSVQLLDRERVEETPGTFGDAVRLVQALPGVAQTQEFSPRAGNLSVRAAEPAESRFLLDNIELPYLYHFNGYSSVLPTRLLDELTLYPSTFDARWGDSIGGIVDTTSRWDNASEAGGSVNVNLIMAGADARVPIGKKWTVRAGGRRSYLDKMQRDDEQYTLFPVFWDTFARVEYAPDGGATDRRWGLLAFGAGDRYTRTVGEPELLDGWEQESDPSFSFDQNYQVLALVHRERVGRTVLDGVLAYVDYHVGGSTPDASEQTREQTIQLREEVVWAPSDTFSASYGIEGRAKDVSVVAATERAWPELAREAPLVGRGVSVDARDRRLLSGAWLDGRWDLGTVRVAPGVRLDHDTLTGEAIPNLRFLTRWNTGPDTHLKAAAGTYSQFPTVLQRDATVGVPDQGAARSRQLAVGVDHAIAGRWEVGVEGWAKDLDEVVVDLPDGTMRGHQEGRAWGLELTSRYRLREVFFMGASLAGGRAERGGIVFAYDQPWAANLVASWDFKPTWNAGLRYRASAGLPYTPVVDGLYEAATDSYAPVYGDTNSARYPTYQKVDVRVEKRWELGRARVSAYGELWWVPNGANTMYQAYAYDYDQTAAVKGPTFLPLVGVRGEI